MAHAPPHADANPVFFRRLEAPSPQRVENRPIQDRARRFENLQIHGMATLGDDHLDDDGAFFSLLDGVFRIGSKLSTDPLGWCHVGAELDEIALTGCGYRTQGGETRPEMKTFTGFRIDVETPPAKSFSLYYDFVGSRVDGKSSIGEVPTG